MNSGADARRRASLDSPGRTARRRVLVVATDAGDGVGLIDELCDGRPADELDVAVVVPSVEESTLKEAITDLDPARERARRRLDGHLDELRRRGIRAMGIVGDSDPILAEQDAIRGFPPDEVVRIGADGLPRGRPPKHELPLSPYLPSFARDSLFAIVFGVLGTAAAAVLAAAGPGPNSAAGAAQILIAIGLALFSLGNVVALALFESVRYRGPVQAVIGVVSLLAVPAAVLANALLLAFS